MISQTSVMNNHLILGFIYRCSLNDLEETGKELPMLESIIQIYDLLSQPFMIIVNNLIRPSLQASEQQELRPQVLAPIILWSLQVEKSQHMGPCLKLDADLPSNLTKIETEKG